MVKGRAHLSLPSGTSTSNPLVPEPCSPAYLDETHRLTRGDVAAELKQLKLEEQQRKQVLWHAGGGGGLHAPSRHAAPTARQLPASNRNRHAWYERIKVRPADGVWHRCRPRMHRSVSS